MLKTKVTTLINNKNNLLRLLSLLVFGIHTTSAQIIINKPILGFSEVCSSSTFNTFTLGFTFTPTTNLISGNQFSIELSDATGSFSSPTLLTTSSSTNSPVNVSFQMPTTVSGNGYKIRVRSSAPVSVSPLSDSFSANYAVYDQPYTINNNVSQQTFCDNSNYVLSVDSGSNSPLQYPQLSYRWYKNNVIIAGQTSSTLSVTTPGIYYSSVNYGICSNNAYSNAVNMTTIPSQNLSITSQNNSTVLCQSQTILLTSSLTGSTNTYQWYFNNNPISGANSSTYSASQAGDYYLKITNGQCIPDSNTITITNSDFNLTLNPSSTVVLLPSQTINITSTTNALNPVYAWYKNGLLISGQTSPSLTVNQPGTYKLKVTQNGVCVTEKEASIIVSYPTNYNLIIAINNLYSDCVSENTSLNISSFTANSNTVNILTSSIPVSYQWFKNNTIITGATTLLFNVANYQGNGVYKVAATLSDGTVVSSNDITVKLKINEVLQLTSSGMLCAENLTVAITPTIQNSLYTYNWYKSGVTNSIGNAMILNATTAGDYSLKISYLGCDVISNTVMVQSISDSMLITNYDSAIEINEGEQITITASGADSYQWISNNIPLGIADNLLVNEASSITLIGFFGNCTIQRVFTVTIKPRHINTFIPNTITPNNDGKNDTWIIPDEFSYKEDIEVVIFNSNQEILYKSTNYNNNWPTEIVSDNTVYYYKIYKENAVIEKGTISVINK